MNEMDTVNDPSDMRNCVGVSETQCEFHFLEMEFAWSKSECITVF